MVAEAILVVLVFVGLYRLASLLIHLVDRIITAAALRWVNRNVELNARLERIAWEMEKLQ
jgi:hypothetical protein